MDCCRGRNLRRTFVAAFPSLAQQICGNQLVQSYSTYFFTLAKISNPLKASVVVSCLGLVGAIIAFFVIEKKVIGRFQLVFGGIIAVTICMRKWVWISSGVRLLKLHSRHRHCGLGILRWGHWKI